MRVFDLNVLYVLEGILSGHSEIVDLHIFAFKEGIHRLQRNARDLYVLASPSKFLAVDIATGKGDMLALAQSLDAVEL